MIELEIATPDERRVLNPRVDDDGLERRLIGCAGDIAPGAFVEMSIDEEPELRFHLRAHVRSDAGRPADVDDRHVPTRRHPEHTDQEQPSDTDQ